MLSGCAVSLVLIRRLSRALFDAVPTTRNACAGALQLIVLLASLSVAAHAQTVYTWAGNDGVNRWTKKKNWIGNLLPMPGETTWLTFTGSVDPININDFATGADFGGFTFAGTTVPFTLTGNGVDLFNGIFNLDAFTQTIGLAGVNLAAPEVHFATVGDLIVTAPVEGAGKLVKTLAGTLVLQAANGYSGGTEIRAGTIEITAPENLGTGALTLAGGALRINNAGTTLLTQNIIVNAPSLLEVTQGTTVLSGAISGNARLVVGGGGLLQGAIDGAAFTGVIDLQGARLHLSATQFVPVDVHGGEADLEGSVGDLQVFDGGTVEVIDPLLTGELRALNLMIEAGGRLALDIGGTNAGALLDGYDQIAVAGTVTLGGVLELRTLAGFTPLIGQTFVLIDNDGTDPILGAFSNALDFISIGGMNFAVSYVGDAGTGQTVGGNDLVLVAVPDIPEWTPLSLGGGVGMLQLFRRRAFKKRLGRR